MQQTRVSKIISWIENAPLIKNVVNWSRKTSLPGFNGVPIYSVAHFFLEEIQKEKITIRANSVAFSFFIALFPFILFLITLISFLPFTSVTEYLNTLHEAIQPVLPESMDSFIFDQVINGIFTLHRGDLLSVGFILALYFASNGLLSLIHGFEKKYQSFSSRNLVKQRLIAIALTLVLGVLLFLGLSLILVSENVVSRFVELTNLSQFSVTNVVDC